MKGISNLVVIGGDGSLTGANLFRQEWSSLVNELLTNGTFLKQFTKLSSYNALIILYQVK